METKLTKSKQEAKAKKSKKKSAFKALLADRDRLVKYIIVIMIVMWMFAITYQQLNLNYKMSVLQRELKDNKLEIEKLEYAFENNDSKQQSVEVIIKMEKEKGE